jgi:hypothetical protein
MKYEWRKREKDIYLPNKKPALLDDSEKWYITVNGVGHPDSNTFRLHIELLYALSYRIRMIPISGITPDGYYEHTVYPLEGI